ncbi:acyltransferase family protein [Mucilaginibacter lappiensis]|uniref:Peptidoglycan/LPS O-acetylase OafA/YrhL n=1 Tax=Mucilaginibacter lappiensis TaxID=354630 RepID=A0A841JQ15_9SPHI|nr:acyltransferase [Mucilaginibacter lappiensis]MBB6131696.1 peptidoglycan/LPS O-acetylase OafA/YrhL [Mucilaginibacter lappiensis]
MPNHKNAFDLLRVIFAIMVLISHGYMIFGTGTEPLQVFSKGQTNLSEIGVMGFFSLSGYLIAASFDRSPHILRFTRNRFLRLFPGYWVCLIITAFIIAPAIFYINNKTVVGFNFWNTDSSFSFVYKNVFLSMRQWSVGNILQNSPYKESLNGSLWSLLPEALCYTLTLFLGFFGLLNKNKQALLLLFILVYIVYVVNLYPGTSFGPTFLTLSNARKLYTCYVCGTCLYVFRNEIFIDGKGQLFIFLASMALIKFGGFLMIAPIAIAILGIKGFSNFQVSLKYDISYGLYIYAFPMQQLLSRVFNPTISIIWYLAACIALTGIVALLSFVWIEQPFLRLKQAPSLKPDLLKTGA